ncbi:unnamed protein product, partial [Ectocarpus sp. 8 AP-2014]
IGTHQICTCSGEAKVGLVAEAATTAARRPRQQLHGSATYYAWAFWPIIVRGGRWRQQQQQPWCVHSKYTCFGERCLAKKIEALLNDQRGPTGSLCSTCSSRASRLDAPSAAGKYEVQPWWVERVRVCAPLSDLSIFLLCDG